MPMRAASTDFGGKPCRPPAGSSDAAEAFRAPGRLREVFFAAIAAAVAVTDAEIAFAMQVADLGWLRRGMRFGRRRAGIAARQGG